MRRKKSVKKIMGYMLIILLVFAVIALDIISEVKLFNWLVSLIPDSPASPWIVRGIYAVIVGVWLYLIFHSVNKDDADENKEE